jgi:hypothetical protein
MKYYLPLLLLLLSSIEGFSEKKQIHLKSVELTMVELIAEASKQTDVELDLQVKESKSLKMFYDCTISLEQLLAAVKGYYKHHAGIDLKIIKTEKGYWMGLEDVIVEPDPVQPVIEQPKTEQKKTVVNPEPSKPTKTKKLKKKTREVFKKSGKKISGLFNKIKTRFDRKKSIEDKENINPNNISKLKIEKKDENQSQVFDALNKVDDSFQISPHKKYEDKKESIIDIELKNNKEHKKQTKKLEGSSLKADNLDMDL